MRDFFIPLQLTNGMQGVYLNTLRGTDEMLVEDASTRTALLLLEKVIQRVIPDTQLATFRVDAIVTADRDRIFAALYMAVYGNKIESTVACQQCSGRFDLDFSLQSLLDHYQLSTTASEKGIYTLENEASFRLPTGADELLLQEISGTSGEDFLLSKCLIAGDIKKVGEQVQQKMAEIAPVLNVAMQANCPECETDQEVHFDIQTFFLTRLKREYALLVNEVHRIAKSYHWSPDAILNLPRHLRKQYVAVIESEF